MASRPPLYTSTSFHSSEAEETRELARSTGKLNAPPLNSENLVSKVSLEFPHVKSPIIRYQLSKHNNNVEKVKQSLKGLGYVQVQVKESVEMESVGQTNKTISPSRKVISKRDAKGLTETTFMKKANTPKSSSNQHSKPDHKEPVQFYDAELQRKKKQLKEKHPWLTEESTTKILLASRNDMALAEGMLKLFAEKAASTSKTTAETTSVKQAPNNQATNVLASTSTRTEAKHQQQTKTTATKKAVPEQANKAPKKNTTVVTPKQSPIKDSKKKIKNLSTNIDTKRSVLQTKQVTSTHRCKPLGPNPQMRKGPNEMNRMGPQASNKCGPNPAFRNGPGGLQRGSTYIFCAV